MHVCVRVCMCVCVGACVGMYHGQVFEDLDPVSWSHVSHVVEVGWVGNQLTPHLWVAQHLPSNTHMENCMCVVRREFQHK